MATIQTTREWDRAAQTPRRMAWPTVPRIGHDVGCHHGLGVTRLEPVECPQEDREGEIEPAVAPGTEDFGDVGRGHLRGTLQSS